ncbi:hypothetical protein UPYG_G00029170 [Umbra pygmaea]|uniref:C2H2-type domain-containing protein n=1 Tax=Umbra pygmaea TaxID=75934 RepID=A0ABD0Y0Y2_UMBPY
MDPMDQYGRNKSSGQPEELSDHSLQWSNVKEESEECEIQQSGPVVSLGDKTSQVTQMENTEKQGSSLVPINPGVTDKEHRHKEITCLKVKVLPVKEESEECFLQPVDENELASSTVKKEENEDWLKSDDEDVEKVTVPWETSETSPSCSDTEESEMDGDHVQDCEVHEHELSGGLKVEDCSKTSMDPETAPDTPEEANAVTGESQGGPSFYPCPHCALGFTIERFFHRHLKRDHREQYIDMLNSGEIMANQATCPQCGKCFSNKYVMKTHLRSHTGEKPYHCAECGRNYALADSLKKHKLEPKNCSVPAAGKGSTKKET